MAITRADLALYLDRRLKNLADLIGQAVRDDTPAGYGDDIDDALQRMQIADVSAANTIPLEASLKHLSEFYALYRFASRLSTRVDIEAYAVDDDRATIFQNVLALMDQAASKAALYGYLVGVPASTTGSGTATTSPATGTGMQPAPITGSWSEGNIHTGWQEGQIAELSIWP